MQLRNRQAFTLIELLVVIVILAVLLAIAVPSYLSQQRKAKDSASKQYLVTAWKAARAAAVENSGRFQTTAASVVSAIQDSEPELTIVAGTSSDVSSSDPKKVVVEQSSLAPTTLILYSESASGTVWELSASNTSAPDLASVTAPSGPTMDGTLTGGLMIGQLVSSLSVSGVTTPIPNGTTITLTAGANQQQFVTSSATSAGAASITVNSQMANFSFPSGATTISF